MEMAELPKEMLIIRRRGLIFRAGLPLRRRHTMAASENTKDNKRVKIVSGVALLVWFALAFILGARESFVRETGAPPLPMLVGVLGPILVFLAAFWLNGPFRDFVMSLDLEVAAGVQAWRLGGLGFIALYAYGILPGLFAWPAGLGDMAIGLAAPWVIFALRRRTDFAGSGYFRVWNLLGILDLVTAVSLGALSAFLGIGISERITTFPMAEMPLVLIPVFLVPLFIMLHIASLVQSRRVATAGKTVGWTGTAAGRGPAGTMTGA